jgi:hypothetical protein
VNLNKKKLDIEFDEVQNSGYDIGTPHVFYHTSADGAWVFGSSAVTTGWYKVEDICFVDQQTYKDFQSGDFVVVTSARADLWTDPNATQTPGYLRMGARLPLIEELDAWWKVRVPVWDELGPRIFGRADRQNRCQPRISALYRPQCVHPGFPHDGQTLWLGGHEWRYRLFQFHPQPLLLLWDHPATQQRRTGKIRHHCLIPIPRGNQWQIAPKSLSRKAFRASPSCAGQAT